MKKNIVNYLGLLGVLSFISYAVAVFVSPVAYPGYNPLSQAVSDLSAASSPSLSLWNKLTCFYNACEVTCTIVVCIGVQGKKTKLFRIGVYLFAATEFVSAVGYRAFPLTDSGFSGTLQDVMHMVITAVVVALSISSLTVIIISGFKNKYCRLEQIAAVVALAMMLVGALGMKIVPRNYFGVVERFSVFAATGFNAFLGVNLFITGFNNGYNAVPAAKAK